MIAGAESTIAGAELSIGGGARSTPKVYKLTPMHALDLIDLFQDRGFEGPSLWSK